MASSHKSIKITVTRTGSKQSVPPSSHQQKRNDGNGSSKPQPGALPENESAEKRPSPVTDLLFDKPHPTNGEASDGRHAERQRPVYHISIVAEMVETHPQTLRMYERMGLLNPQRTRNNVRLYSEDDVHQVRRIQHLTQDLGVNLAGVEVVFKLLREMHQLREELEHEIENAVRQNQDNNQDNNQDSKR